MNPQKIVASLELSQEYARLMKEKGGEMSESYFGWHPDLKGVWHVMSGAKSEDGRKMFPAYTAGEIGELLPYEMCDEHQDLPYFLTCEKREDPDYWMVYYNGDRGVLGDIEEAPTEADARLKMLNYLLANDLI